MAEQPKFDLSGRVALVTGASSGPRKVVVGAAFAGAHHAVLPLTAPEQEVLFDLVAARMVTTVAITSWRAAKYPEDAAYILRNVPSARAGLQAFARADRDHVKGALALACPDLTTLKEDMT